MQKLTKLGPDPFPIVSPEAQKIVYKDSSGNYLVAYPYNTIYSINGPVFRDMDKAFKIGGGCRGNLIIGTKATGKTHLLAIEADYAKSVGARIIVINNKEYDFLKLADLRVSKTEVKNAGGIVKAICRKLEVEPEDIDALKKHLESKNWGKVQIIVDDIYENEWGIKEVMEDLFDLMRLHTASGSLTIRTSVALHTSIKHPVAHFFDLYRDDLVTLITSYEDGSDLVHRAVNAMIYSGDLIPGATMRPIVTEWARHTSEEHIEKALMDFFEKYVSTLPDPELRSLKLTDLADESFIAHVVYKALYVGGLEIYRVFSDELRRLWREYAGEKVKIEEYADALKKYTELETELEEAKKKEQLHRFYKKLIEGVIENIMVKYRRATLSATRKYVVTESREVRWRNITYYRVDGEELVIIVPNLVTRKTGVVVERPIEVGKKIEDIRVMMPNSKIVAVVIEDIDMRGLTSKLGTGNYAIVTLPKPTRPKLKYFYALLLTGRVSRELLAKNISCVRGSKTEAVKAFLGFTL